MSVDQKLSVKNLNLLPMFNPLNTNSFFPLDTVFEQSLFFQSQKSLQPFRNSLPCKNPTNQSIGVRPSDYMLTTAETHDLFEY